MKKYGGHFDVALKEEELMTLEQESQDETFWKRKDSQEVMEKISQIKKEIDEINELKEYINSIQEFMELELEESMILDIKENIKVIKNTIEKIKIKSLLNGEFDHNNAYMEIHSGAGGTESNDWANMLKRMYLRYFDKKGYKYEIISEQPGEEVGIKGVTFKIKGLNVFGYLKSETGVHRLVRISPFDSNKRRHTSFASVLVTPEININIEIEIKENELKIDVYRSSGAGGQSVNTTDSAVRITHLPTGIVVTCQNERSQIQNKEKAIDILKQKLYLLEREKVDKQLSNLKGSVMDVNFGSQIRNYVMHPYSLVKDLRTNVETSNVEKVLDGDIDIFIESYVKRC